MSVSASREEDGEPEPTRMEEERSARPNSLPNIQAHEDMVISKESPDTPTDGTAEDEQSQILTSLTSGINLVHPCVDLVHIVFRTSGDAKETISQKRF